MARASTSSSGNEPKESRDQKRSRLQHEKEAKAKAKRYVFPLLVLVIGIIAGFFIWRYGWGQAPKSNAMNFENFEEQLAKLDPEILKKFQEAAANGNFEDLLGSQPDDSQASGTDIDLDATPEHDEA